MSCVHYKFSSQLDYNTVTFSGLHITLSELKKQIMAQERLKAANCDLQITNAQTGEEYGSNDTHVPKHSSVIVRRTPTVEQKRTNRTSSSLDRPCMAAGAPPKTTRSSASASLANLFEATNMEDATEEEKIKARMYQSTLQYDPKHYSKKAVGAPPANYTCFRCLKPGHYIRQCPLLTFPDKGVECPKAIKTSKGIPRSFMVKAEPGTKGAMLTSTGEYMIPAIDAEAYAKGKKERPPFVPLDQSSSSAAAAAAGAAVTDDPDQIPTELLCPICNDLITDGVLIPCCGNSYCDECIRNNLLESEEHICFSCQQSVSPDDLVTNKFLRQAVDNFKNSAGYTKHTIKKFLTKPQHPLVANATDPHTTDKDKAPVAPTDIPGVSGTNPTEGLVVSTDSDLASTPTPSMGEFPPAAPVSTLTAALTFNPAGTTAATPSHPSSAAIGGEGGAASTQPVPSFDQRAACSTTRDEDLPSGDMKYLKEVPDVFSDIGSQGCPLSVIGHPTSPKPLPSPGHESRPQQPHRGRGRQWKRSYKGGGIQPPSYHQAAPAPAPAPPPLPPSVYSASVYPPPPQSYPPPYTLGPSLIPPPTLGYQPPPFYPHGPPGFVSNWVAPSSCPLVAHPARSLPRHPPFEEGFYRQQHRQECGISKGDEFVIDYHKELMEYRITQEGGPCFRADSLSKDHGPSYGFSATRSCYSSRSYGHSCADSPHSLASYSVGSWDKTEGGKRYRSQSRSPARQNPLQWEAEQYGSRRPDLRREDHWERDRYNHWKEEYEDWYQQYYKDYENQDPSPRRRRRSRDKKERTSPVSKSHFTQKRKKRSVKRDKCLFQNPSSSSSSGTKSSKKVLKRKTFKKKAKLMNNVTPLNKTPSITATPSTDTEVTRTSAPQNLPAPVQPRTSTKSKTRSDKTRKEKGYKVKVRGEKMKGEQKDRSSVGDFIKKREFPSSSSSSSLSKPSKTVTVKPKETRSSKKYKRSTVTPDHGKTHHHSSKHHVSHGGPQCGQDIRSAHLPPVTHQREPPSPQLHASPVERHRRGEEENHSLTGRPEKWKRTEVTGDVLAQPQPQVCRLSVSADGSSFAPQLTRVGENQTEKQTCVT